MKSLLIKIFTGIKSRAAIERQYSLRLHGLECKVKQLESDLRDKRYEISRLERIISNAS